jgi:cell division protein FtsB
LKRIAVWLAAALSMAAVATLGHQGLAEVFRLTNQRNTLQAETIVLLERNHRMMTEIERLKKEPLAAEEVARAELGLAKPDEIVYVFKSTPSRLDRRGPDVGHRPGTKNQD